MCSSPGIEGQPAPPPACIHLPEPSPLFHAGQSCQECTGWLLSQQTCPEACPGPWGQSQVYQTGLFLPLESSRAGGGQTRKDTS